MRGFRWSLLVVSLALFLALPAWGQVTLKVANIPIASSLPYFAALDKKFFEEEGLKLETEFMPGAEPLLRAIAGGSIQIGFVNYVSVLIANSRGFDFVIIAPQNRTVPIKTDRGVEDGSPVLALEDSPVKSVKDLKGKTLAVNALYNINDLYFREWLSQNGIDPKKDVSWIEVPFPRMGPTLRGRKADAAFATEPYFTAEREAGGIRILGFPYAEVEGGKPLEIAGYVVGRSWLEKNQDLVERFVRAFYKGMDYINTHTDERLAILTRHIKVNPELLKKMRQWDWHHPIDRASLQHQAELAHKWGMLDAPIDVNRFVHATALR